MFYLYRVLISICVLILIEYRSLYLFKKERSFAFHSFMHFNALLLYFWVYLTFFNELTYCILLHSLKDIVQVKLRKRLLNVQNFSFYAFVSIIFSEKEFEHFTIKETYCSITTLKRLLLNNIYIVNYTMLFGN